MGLGSGIYCGKGKVGAGTVSIEYKRSIPLRVAWAVSIEPPTGWVCNRQINNRQPTTLYDAKTSISVILSTIHPDPPLIHLYLPLPLQPN